MDKQVSSEGIAITEKEEIVPTVIEDTSTAKCSSLEKGVQSEMAINVSNDSKLRETTSETSLRSFVSAVNEKYDFVPHIVNCPVKVTGSGSIVLPKMVSMSGQDIGFAGDPAYIEKMCQHVQELGLMENRFTKWEEVLTIISCSPQLTFLNLAKNHLTSPIPSLADRVLPNLTHLVLNDTCITWDDLLTLLKTFPNIEELFLSKNNFSSVDLPAIDNLPSTDQRCNSSQTDCQMTDLANQGFHSYSSLQRLFFVGNSVSSFRELCKLGLFFPNLTLLMLSETENLEEFGDVSNTYIEQSFPLLTTLGLNRTAFKSWTEIEKLRHFPSLTDVRLKGIPFLDNLEEKFRRQHTVALLPNIASLNISPIYDSEREDAERAFIRLYMHKEDKPKRYIELERIHGQLDHLAKVDLAADTSVKIKVKVEDMERNEISAQDFDIDTSQTFRQLMKLMSNIANCPRSQLLMYYRNSDNWEQKLLSSDRRVHSLCMRDGDSIVIVYKS